MNKNQTNKIKKLIKNYKTNLYNDYRTNLYLSTMELRDFSSCAALELIIALISNIKTKDEYNKFSIAWYDTDSTLDDSDIVVSIYSVDEIPESDINSTNDISEKCSCFNDADVHNVIYLALKLKAEELLKN